MAARRSGRGDEAQAAPSKKSRPRPSERRAVGQVPPAAAKPARQAPSPEAMARAKAKLSPPRAPWHPLPLAELAIAVGFLAILAAAWLANDDGILAGFLLIVAGTAEFSWREHRHGYRPHATVLAMMLGFAVGALCWRFTGLQRNPCVVIGGVVFVIAWGLFDKAYVPAARRHATDAPGDDSP